MCSLINIFFNLFGMPKKLTFRLVHQNKQTISINEHRETTTSASKKNFHKKRRIQTSSSSLQIKLLTLCFFSSRHFRFWLCCSLWSFYSFTGNRFHAELNFTTVIKSKNFDFHFIANFDNIAHFVHTFCS